MKMNEITQVRWETLNARTKRLAPTQSYEDVETKEGAGKSTKANDDATRLGSVLTIDRRSCVGLSTVH